MAQETQYCSLRYILGTVYSANTEASEISPAKCPWLAKCPVAREVGEVGLAEEVVGNPGPSVTYGSQQTQPCCGW